VEGHRVDRISKPAAIVDVAMNEIVSSDGVRDVRRVVSLENGQAEGDGGDQSGRSGVHERVGLVYGVAESASRGLLVDISDRKSGAIRSLEMART